MDELVVLARGGSTEAAGALFDRYWVVGWRVAYAITADRALADDAGQEAFVKEGDVDGVVSAVRRALGSGPTVGRRIEGHGRALMPYVAMLAVVPLGFVLLRRNL